MRSPSKFKKCDVTRAMMGVLATGREVARVEIGTDGSIVVVPTNPKEPTQKDETPEDLRKLI